ncbi:unannotated protein [freshwater metagenome]|uniref:Unannotated protein n=1 Tax=freshwater metagenome TaxID=449393 RepID=A0A6J6GBV5_9ZZZZ
MPGSARIADPGLQAVIPGKGEIMIAPVSVCHHVSTIGQRSPPITVWYQTHASGLIGSPTEPSNRSEERLCACGNSSPHFIHVRISVGAVYKIVTPYFSTISNIRPLCGVSGVPSYIT